MKYPFSQCSVVIDKNGVVLSAFPDTCKKLVGLDLSTQGVVVEALNDQTPILSDFFLMEKEEFWAVFQSYPVYTKIFRLSMKILRNLSTVQLNLSTGSAVNLHLLNSTVHRALLLMMRSIFLPII